MKSTPSERVIAYIDGFNLYFGLRDSGLRRLYWLNVQAMSENLLRERQQLVLTKYFTARISGRRTGDPPEKAYHADAKRKRQSDFLEALATLEEFELYEGHYLDKDVRCRACGASWRSHEEKMTDVQIATEMLTDAFQDRFDTALLISADSDLVPPVRAVRRLWGKRVVLGFPPSRSSIRLKQAANASISIPADVLDRSQFPQEVVKSDGYPLSRPERWR